MVLALVTIIREMDNAYLVWRAEQADRERPIGAGTSGRTVGNKTKAPK